MEKDPREWAELILEAAIKEGDARPLVELAVRAGVDLDALQGLINATLDAVYDHLTRAAAGTTEPVARPETGDEDRLLSIDDLTALKDLGIAAN